MIPTINSIDPIAKGVNTIKTMVIREKNLPIVVKIH
jgi:hypothetical protein